MEEIVPGIRLQLDEPPRTLAAIAHRRPRGVYLVVPLRLVTTSGASTATLGAFELVDRGGRRFAPERDPWLLKAVSLNLRRLPLLGAGEQPGGFLIQTQPYRWEVRPLGSGRTIAAFLLFDVPPDRRGFTLEYDQRRFPLGALPRTPAPLATPTP